MIEEKILPVLQIGVMQFTVGNKYIPWREVEGIGFQWFRDTDKSWQPLRIDESDLKKIAFKTHERIERAN